VKPEYRLKLGDRVRVPPVRTAAPKPAVLQPLPLPVVHEDASLLVIDKPPGVAVHGGSGVSYGVIESLRAERPQAKVLELAHRLDRDTSGLLIIAKKRSALVELHRMLREGEVEKIYLAVVAGAYRGPKEIRAALHKYVTGAGERRVAVREGGVSAATRIEVLRESPGFSVLEVRLLTGRTHQIRVHLAHVGHPVLGDQKYGGDAKKAAKRLLLHASRLSFRHPATGEHMRLEAPLPPELKAFA
jgi:23S rRNA pseudouridine955/2504/2580 synthase